jgi:hypothetical protein
MRNDRKRPPAEGLVGLGTHKSVSGLWWPQGRKVKPSLLSELLVDMAAERHVANRYRIGGTAARVRRLLLAIKTCKSS